MTRVARHATVETAIRSFRHAGLEKFFKAGSKAGIPPLHAARLRRRLTALNLAMSAADRATPGWSFHALRGGLDGRFAISVNDNWRMTFTFEGADAILVDYVDYH